MTSSQTNYYNFPPFSPLPHYFSPPPLPAAKPPSHSTPPPPPHVNPPPPHVLPPPPPPSPSPNNNPTVIIVVFASLGCLFFLAFLSVALCCFLKKRKKKMVHETDIINVEEHLKMKEAIVPGPHGEQASVLLVDDDVHIQEHIKKNGIVGKGHLHSKSAQTISSAIGKKKKKMVQETDIVNVDEHLKVKGAMLAGGPHGAQALALSVEDDKHIHEEIKKNEVQEGKGKKMVQETEVVDVEEHWKVKEGVIAGPHGEQALLLTKEDDVHIQAEIRKNEKVGEGLHSKLSAQGITSAMEKKVGEGLHSNLSAQGITSAIEKEEGSSISHHRLGHKA